jgi:hypothetical protein
MTDELSVMIRVRFCHHLQFIHIHYSDIYCIISRRCVSMSPSRSCRCLVVPSAERQARTCEIRTRELERERAGSSERVSLEGSKSVVAAECRNMSVRNGGGSGGGVATAVIVVAPP